jgi:hypothetical protein
MKGLALNCFIPATMSRPYFQERGDQDFFTLRLKGEVTGERAAFSENGGVGRLLKRRGEDVGWRKGRNSLSGNLLWQTEQIMWYVLYSLRYPLRYGSIVGVHGTDSRKFPSGRPERATFRKALVRGVFQKRTTTLA